MSRLEELEKEVGIVKNEPNQEAIDKASADKLRGKN